MLFEPFAKHDLQVIHELTLEILQHTGVIMKGDRARKALREAGCQEERGRMFFPPTVVEEALKNPAEITLYDRSGEKAYPLTKATRSYSHNFGSVSVLLDVHSNTIREATVKDMEEFTRLSDYLPHLDKVVPSLRPDDLPQEIAPIAMTVYSLKNTTKPTSIGTASDPWEVKTLVEVAAAVRGSLDNLRLKPMGTISISPLSPLEFPEDIAEAIVEAALTGLPLTMLPCPTRGFTAPLTLIGGLVQQNAEQLAFLTLAKAVNPRCPLVYTCRLAAANMRTGFVGGNDPDPGFSGACAAQIARSYGLPSGVYGLDTAAVLPDIQSGYERALNGLPPVLAGATFVSGMGLLNGGLLASAEQLVIDDEIYSMLTHRQGNFAKDRAAVGVEVIKAVTEGGNFLAQEHTRTYMRKGDLWMGLKLGNPLSFEEWRLQERKGIREKARELVLDILAKHEVPPLEEKLARELDGILKRAWLERTK